MKNFKRTLSLLLSIVMIASMLTVVATAQTFAAEADTTEVGAVTSADSFSWDNASVYFVLTDRFVNGDTSNDHSYNRLINKDGSVVTNSMLNSDAATFHGGDFKGLTSKIEDGYFDDLGVNALWITAPYEQIHGYVIVNEGKSNSVKHYAYHGYYAMDYTQTDANFGTAAEFKKLVDTAHEHDIRIVLDIVMNHPGYNTIYDMYEYNYGAFKTGYGDNYAWDAYYSWKNNANYHASIDYTSSGAAAGWARWWGPNWLRNGIVGHTPFGGDDLTKSAGGDLSDFKTESTASVNVPTFLQEKWRKEGRYDTEMSGLNSWFSKTGNAKTVRNHLVYWLSEWVREYGVDGFRCDTAKHVELASWKALSDECTKALNEWRAANKGKVAAASWTDDFWMTAEDYGAGVNKDNYFTQGGFDSKINFQFTGGGGVPNSGSINNTYSEYANKINSDPNFNMLTYISSHDTALCRNDLIYQGSAFQLMPGAIQIFYGDESNRPLVNSNISGIKDHLLRSDMNWSSMDNNVLTHWQKVGQFRNNHVAVGAGSHSSITATSGTAFAREYNKNGVNDTVFAVIAANKNTNVTLTVGSFVADGTVLKNTYDNSTATVSGGKVTFNSGANGTILVEVAGATKSPDVSVSHTGGNFADTLSITATLNEYATSGTYKIGNASPVTFTGSKTITIGADMAFDESVTIKFTATDGTDTKERSYTYTKIDPNATPFKFPTERTTYLVDTAGWGSAYCYAWITGGSDNAKWPGLVMTEAGTYEGKTVYSYEVPASMDNVIFNNGSGTQTDNLTFTKHAYYDNGAQKWVPVDVPTPLPTQPVTQPTQPVTQPTQPVTQPTQPVTQPTQNGPVTGDVILGDADANGKISVLDATAIQRYIADIDTFTENQLLASNVNGDKLVDVLDATTIQRHLAEIDNRYPIGEVIKSDTPVIPTQPVTPTQPVQPTQPTQPTEQLPTEEPTTIPIPDVNTIYVDMGYQADAYAHYWEDGGDAPLTWPGLKMEHVTGNVYKIDVPANFNKIIFSNNSTDQTGNLDIQGNGYIYTKNSGSWSIYDGNGGGGNTTPTTPTPTPGNFDFSNPRTIVVLDDGNWGSVYIHYWSGSGGTVWPGEQMTSIGQVNGHNAYAFTLDEQYSSFVINIGSNANQSGDLTVGSPYQAFLTSSKTFVDASSYLK
ncbi:MAG: starch-binding protein [Ruminococcaceae bacterium]|nr:starch-binding protein [Oscillospiraceae bacterium]